MLKVVVYMICLLVITAILWVLGTMGISLGQTGMLILFVAVFLAGAFVCSRIDKRNEKKFEERVMAEHDARKASSKSIRKSVYEQTGKKTADHKKSKKK